MARKTSLIIDTPARLNFGFALGDVGILLRFHDSNAGEGKGRPVRELEVFKRAGLILAVTAWENFIENTLKDLFKAKLSAAKSPDELKSTFNAVAQAWLARQGRGRDRDNIKPEDLLKWTLNGWKIMISEKFSSEIDALNSPNSGKVKDLFKRYLGDDLTKSWHWQGVSAEAACGRLDRLIQLRGRLVHGGLEVRIHRDQVVEGIDLLERLVDRTEACLVRIAPPGLYRYFYAFADQSDLPNLREVYASRFPDNVLSLDVMKTIARRYH